MDPHLNKDLWSAIFTINGIDVVGLPINPPLRDGDSETVVVPLPRVYTLQWTEPASTTREKCNFPPTDADLISIPDPQENPALYNAAVDIIRLANDFFVKSGCARVDDKELKGYAHAAKKESVKLSKRFMKKYADKFYPPPDPRILAVTDMKYHPSDKAVPWKNRLWIVACQKYEEMNEKERIEMIRKSHAEQQDQYARSFTDVKHYNKFLVDMFVTYIGHQHLTNSKANWEDCQPDSADIDEFFSRPENQKGATLYDLHRYFYLVKDVKEFVRRIQHFATYHPSPPPVSGLDEIPEGVYVRKPIPSVAQIEALLETPFGLTLPELFEELEARYAEFATGVGSEWEVVQNLKTVAAPDISTGLWIKKLREGLDNCPTEGELEDVLALCEALSMREITLIYPMGVACVDVLAERLQRVAAQDLTTGKWIRKDVALPHHTVIQKAMLASPGLSTMLKTMTEVIGLFPDQVWSRDSFAAELGKAAYLADEETGEYLPLWPNPRDGGNLSARDSDKIHYLKGVLETDPQTFLGLVSKGAFGGGDGGFGAAEEWVPNPLAADSEMSPASPLSPSGGSKRKRAPEPEGGEEEEEEEEEPERASKKPRTKGET